MDHLAEDFDDITFASGSREIEGFEAARDEMGAGKCQTRGVVSHIIGPQHHPTAKQGADMIEMFRPDQDRFFMFGVSIGHGTFIK